MSCGCCDFSVPDVHLEASTTSLGFNGNCGFLGYLPGSTTYYSIYSGTRQYFTDPSWTTGGSCSSSCGSSVALAVVDGVVTCQQTDTGDCGTCDPNTRVYAGVAGCAVSYSVNISGVQSDTETLTDIEWSQSCPQESGPTYTVSNKKYIKDALSGDAIDVMAFLSGHLPAYSAWGADSAPSAITSSQPGSYNLMRSQARVTHQPSPTCYLKVWLQARDSHDAGGETVTALAPYEWSATGNPCVSDRTSYIVGAAFDVPAPSGDGTVTVEMVAWSCRRDYDPTATTPHGPDGFPPPPTA